MCLRRQHKKASLDPAAPVRTPDGSIALRRNGKPWRDGEQLQKQSSNFPHALEAKGLVQPGLILHRLRVSFAASIKRQTRANDSTVPAALGDRDTRMGACYTRHGCRQKGNALP